MNAKFFCDTKDLFKYDLITSVIRRFGGRVDRIVIVPMLTKYDPSFRGNPGCRNTDLIACFRRLRQTEEVDRYYDELKSYLKELKTDIKKEKIRVRVEKEKVFSNERRSEYFQAIWDNYPKASLIFVDPDTGITPNKPTEKHLAFPELKRFFELLDDDSILMVYQHYQRRRLSGHDAMQRKFEDISRLTGSVPLIIGDNTVMFIFLTRNAEIRENLEQILRNYARIEQVAARSRNTDRVIRVIAAADEPAG
jgi:hypothetical protein